MTDDEREAELARYDWKRLSRMQLGRYAEYFTMMEFTQFGFQVYSTEVDDRGVDFVVRGESGKFYEIQVKSLRDRGYTYLRKDTSSLSHERLVALLLFNQGRPPSLFLIPTVDWNKQSSLLVSRDYAGKRSKPEWGIQVSKKTVPMLEAYAFTKTIRTL
jgi:hypothetical protein